MQLLILKISIVRRDEETSVLILPCNCTEISHVHTGAQVMDGRQGPKFHTALQQQCGSELTQVSALGFEIQIFCDCAVSRPYRCYLC